MWQTFVLLESWGGNLEALTECRCLRPETD